MPADREPSAPQTLTSVLDVWRSADPARGPVADVVAAAATAATQVAALVASSPLAAPDPSLDVRAEQLFVEEFTACDVARVCSEERDTAIDLTPGGSLVVTLDPIEGSRNIDVNALFGSIFGVLPTAGLEDDLEGASLQPGRNLAAAGIVVYGPRTLLAVTWGDGTDFYTLDPLTHEFVMARHRVIVPLDAQEYAINASNARHWGAGTRAYISDLVEGSLGPRERDFTMRWFGALVAETHRILLRGGIFLYPADERPAYRHGRIRLVFQANPVAFLCEQAGAAATDGVTRILDLQPTGLRQRTPLVFGSRHKVERVRRYLVDPPTVHEASPLFSERGLFPRMSPTDESFNRLDPAVNSSRSRACP